MSFNHNVSISQNRLRTSYEIYCTFANMALLACVHTTHTQTHTYIHIHFLMAHVSMYVCRHTYYVHLYDSLGVCGKLPRVWTTFSGSLIRAQWWGPCKHICPVDSMMVCHSTGAHKFSQGLIALKCLLRSLTEPVITHKVIQLCLFRTINLHVCC